MQKRKARLIGSKLSRDMEENLSSYAFAARVAGVSLLASAIPAGAAPVCHNLSGDLSQTANFAFNPGSDIAPAFNVAQSFHTFSTHTNTGINRGFFTPNLPGAEIALSAKGLPVTFASGASIGPAGKFGRGKAYGLLFTYVPYYQATYNHHRGNLQFGKPNYFGFSFQLSGQTHYGWIRLTAIIHQFRTPYVETKIDEYGVESTPNTAIQAGDCGANSAAAPRDSARSTDVHPPELGFLALGAHGISLWRRKTIE